MTNASSVENTVRQWNEEERKIAFAALNKNAPRHKLEEMFETDAETIMEAIHIAPELTRRMLRGVIADAAFSTTTIPELENNGWERIREPGNYKYDHKLKKEGLVVTVQVKLQRSEKSADGTSKPVETDGYRFELEEGFYLVEPQKTRGGTKKNLKKKLSAKDQSLDKQNIENELVTSQQLDTSTAELRGENATTEEMLKTRPYQYGDFDILAVSLQPSSNKQNPKERWSHFRYTVAAWLLPAANNNDIKTYQPVAKDPNDDWTDDFETAVKWLKRGDVHTIQNNFDPKKPKKPRKGKNKDTDEGRLFPNISLEQSR